MRHIRKRKIKRFGYIRDGLDFRDSVFEGFKAMLLPQRIDLRPLCPPIYDQGQIGSCVSNAICAAKDFERKREGQEFLHPSRLFNYYCAREIEDTVDFDSGAQLRDGIKAAVNLGICAEIDWPYDIGRFTEKPSTTAYNLAEQNQVLRYRRIRENNINTMMECLAGGLPFVFGFACYESWESEQVYETGILPMPQVSESVIGGHAVMACGFDRSTKRFLVRNSYGADFGQEGYFWIDFDYLANPQLAADFWVISRVEI